MDDDKTYQFYLRNSPTTMQYQIFEVGNSSSYVSGTFEDPAPYASSAPANDDGYAFVVLCNDVAANCNGSPAYAVKFQDIQYNWQ